MSNASNLIVFRVFANQNSGLGHLVRCVVLARALLQKGMQVLLLGDFVDDRAKPFLTGIPFDSLYDSSVTAWDDVQDAELFLSKLTTYSASLCWVVLDHYYLNQSWESQVLKTAPLKLLVIDDLARAHDCNAVLDFKWRGLSAAEVYRSRVSSGADLLLGPQFLLVPPVEHSSVQSLASDAKTSFNVLISLGGGGQASLLLALIQSLLKVSQTSSPCWHVKVVLGPFLDQPQLIKDFIEQENLSGKVSLIEGKNDLSADFAWCDLYLGAAGGSLYQLRLLQKPLITFSLAQNQQTDQVLLDDIGQYFHLNEFDLSQADDLAKLVQLVSEQYSRIQALFAKAKIELDDQGANRVAEYLIHGKIPDPIKLDEMALPLASNGNIALPAGFSLRAVQDQDINHYLNSRNLMANRKNMIDAKPIEPLGHYQWWFKTQRRSFLLSKDKQPLLYIWDELRHLDGEDFLIGGWFVCDEQTSFQEAMVALDWQLKQCALDYPMATWIAVISRQNKYVKLMNDYFGFKEIDTSSRYHSVVQKLFAHASEQEFFYVYK